MRTQCPWLFCLCLLLPGCDPGTPVQAVPAGTTTGPHGGIAMPLPDGAGYVEILVEKEGAEKSKSRAASRTVPPRFVVFFLNAERNGPLDPAPTEVRVNAALPTGATATVALTASPRPGDAAGTTRFLSEPGDFDYDELFGEVTATIGGRPASVPFALR